MGTKIGGPGFVPFRSGGARGTRGDHGLFSVTKPRATSEEATGKIDQGLESKDSQLNPPSHEKSRLRELKDDVSRTLSTELSVIRVNVVGSEAKGTQIRRRRGNDIDLQVLLDPKVHGDWLGQGSGPSNALRGVKAALDRNPNYQGARIEQDRNVVTVKVGGATVDIAPTFAKDSTNPRQEDSFEFPHLGEMLPVTPGRIPDTTGSQRWL